MTLRFDWIKIVTLLFFSPGTTLLNCCSYNLCGSLVIRPKCYWFRLPILYDDFFCVYYFVRGTLYVHNLVSIVCEYGIDFF